MVGAQAALNGSIRSHRRCIGTLVLVATLGLAGARAQAPDGATLHEGTMVVDRAEGHDCVPPLSRTVPVELAIGVPAAADALLGFGDGNVVRATLRDGRVAFASDGFALADAMRPAGAVVALLAPGTETCRWSGTIRLRPASGATFRERAQSLVARAAADDLMAQGVALLEQGKGPEGRQVLEQGAALRASVLGDEHWLTLRAQLRVARGLQIDGKTDAALALAQRIVDVQMRTPSTDAFERLRAQAGVATMLWSSGRPGDALPQMQQVFEELRDRYGPRHLETLTTEINLGLVLWDLARLDEAAAHLESLLPAIVEIRGEQHPRSLDAMNNLGLIYQGLGRHAEALELLERAYRLGVASVGANHRDTLSTLANVAVGYAALERMEDALALYRAASERLYARKVMRSYLRPVPEPVEAVS